MAWYRHLDRRTTGAMWLVETESWNPKDSKEKTATLTGFWLLLYLQNSRIGQYIAPSMCFFCSSVFQIQCWCERESKTASFRNDSTTLHLAPKRNQFMCADSLWQTPCFVSFDVCWLPILPKVSTIEQSLKMSKRKAIALCHNTTIQIPVLGMMACLSKFVSWPSCPSRLCDWIFRDSKAPRSGKSKEHLRNLHLNAQEAWNLGSWKTAWWYTGGRLEWVDVGYADFLKIYTMVCKSCAYSWMNGFR